MRTQKVFDKIHGGLTGTDRNPVSEQVLDADQGEVQTETGVQGTEVQTEETHNDIASLYKPGVSNSIYLGAAGGRASVRLGRIRYSTKKLQSSQQHY